MLKDIVILALVAQGVASTVIAYKSYKAVKELEAKIAETTEEVKGKIDKADIKGEIYKHFFNLVYIKLRT